MNSKLTDDIFQRLQKNKEFLSKDLSQQDIQMILHELDTYETELLAQNEELLRTQSELRVAKLEYETLFRNSPITLVIIDRSLNVVRFNKLAEDNFTFSQKNLMMYISKEDKKPFIEWFEFNKFEESSIIVTLKCSNKSYKKFKIEGNIFPNNLKWVMLSLSDIDKEYNILQRKIHTLEEEKQEQQKILLTQSKIAAMGEMLGNIAHQWRQPLSVISTHVSSLKLFNEMGNLSPQKIDESTDSVLYQVDYLSKTIEDFRSFFKSDTLICRRFNVKDTLEKIYKLVMDSLANNFIQCETTAQDVYLECNENQLIQGIVNICNNAKDAMVSKISDTDERYFVVNLIEEDGNAVITFRDSGGGIDEEIIDKIFEPYFSTKHQSVGTGIGLYMTHQIITNQFHGVIQVKNVDFEHDGKALKGAEFVITIPLDAKEDSKN